jgi:hypothetical protein
VPVKQIPEKLEPVGREKDPLVSTQCERTEHRGTIIS